jgi:hypothetical protein
VSCQYSIDVVNILRAVWDSAAEASDSEELTEAEYRAQRREAITSAAHEILAMLEKAERSQ